MQQQALAAWGVFHQSSVGDAIAAIQSFDLDPSSLDSNATRNSCVLGASFDARRAVEREGVNYLTWVPAQASIEACTARDGFLRFRDVMYEYGNAFVAVVHLLSHQWMVPKNSPCLLRPSTSSQLQLHFGVGNQDGGFLFLALYTT